MFLLFRARNLNKSVKFCNSKRFSSDTTNHEALIQVGQAISVRKHITSDDLKKFSELSGDTNPIHFENGTEKAVVHGAFLNGLVSGVIGTRLPGPGTLVISQNLIFPNKCFAGEYVKITVNVIESRKIIKVGFVCEVEEQDKIVLRGDARLIFNK